MMCPCWYFCDQIQVDNDIPFRVVFELRPDMAPRMVENFTRLCKGLPDGRGYKVHLPVLRSRNYFLRLRLRCYFFLFKIDFSEDLRIPNL